MLKQLEHNTVNSKQCAGRPCIRGIRIRASDVLDLFAAGLSAEQILEMDDLSAAIIHTAHKLNHPVLAAWQRFGSMRTYRLQSRLGSRQYRSPRSH